ncbi:MAG: diacylglycerol/lipid kinase family protein [Novosphingobium sp.]
MTQTIAVIVNASGGRASREGAALKDKLVAAFAAQGVAVDPQLVEGNDLAQAISSASGADVVAVGGGDGTQGSAAALLSRSGQVMAVLPLGTLNHLALDLHIPDELNAAAQIATGGAVRAIDFGEAGDQVFVNNASVGLYTRLVRNRDASSLPKWLATIPAAWTVLKGLKVRRLVIEIDGTRNCVETPLLFIGNNPYNLTGDRVGKRDKLDTGILGLNAVRHKNLLALIGFALRALIGRADPARDFVDIEDCAEFVLHGNGSIDVAHDGEVTRMPLPLRFRSLPGALRVKVPG